MSYFVILCEGRFSGMAIDLEEQYDKIYRYCYMRLRHPQAAEDITQETFLRFLENHTYREMGKQLGYLYRIAGNLCIDAVRRRREEPFSQRFPGETVEIADETSDHQEKLTLTASLEAAVQSLEPREQELIFLRYVNELPVGTVAEILGISRFAVYRKTQECLKKLKKELS